MSIDDAAAALMASGAVMIPWALLYFPKRITRLNAGAETRRTDAYNNRERRRTLIASALMILAGAALWFL